MKHVNKIWNKNSLLIIAERRYSLKPNQHFTSYYGIWLKSVFFDQPSQIAGAKILTNFYANKYCQNHAVSKQPSYNYE